MAVDKSEISEGGLTRETMKHTEDSIRAELLEAHARGRAPEIRDLTLLLSHARGDAQKTYFDNQGRPKYPDAYTDELKAARNRQAQRRLHRDGSDHRARWCSGDYILAPDGTTLLLEARESDSGMYVCRRMTDAPGTGRIRLTPEQMKRPPTGESPMVVLSRASDALYHATCDRREGKTTDEELGVALVAYEDALAALGL